MKGLKFAILSHGYIENDLAWNVAMTNPATRSNRHPEPVWGQFPTFSVLVRHPSEGYILFDTGSSLGDDAGRRPESMDDIFPLFIRREEYLDGCLERLGLTVDDINIVVCSHMHWDHSGGLCFFENKKSVQKVITSKDDYTFGLLQTLAPNKVSDDCAYFRENYLFNNLDYTLIDRDCNLCEGIDLILLPGHTPAVLGMMLHLESGTVIFPSDAIGSRSNYGEHAKFPGIIYDSLGFKAAVAKVMDLEKKYNANIIHPHDMEQFKSLKQAPHFYD